MKNLIKDVLELFYPRVCCGCGSPLLKGEDIICLSCNIKLPRTEFKFNKDNPIEKMFWGRLPIKHASSFLYFRKSGLTQRLIHQLKYMGNKEIGYYLGYIYGQEIKDSLQAIQPDFLIAVPLHSEKIKLRGFNQSEEIARGIAESTGIPFISNVLLRNEATATQTKKKRYQRWENTENKFDLNVTIETEGKHIILIDDVITTGATLEACGNTLLVSSGVSISMVSLCFAIH